MQDKNNEWKMTGCSRGRGRGGFVPQFRNPQSNQYQIDHRNPNLNNIPRFNQDMNPRFRSPPPWLNPQAQFHWQQNIRMQRPPLFTIHQHPPTRHRFHVPRYTQSNNQNNQQNQRPISPLPGSEEARQRTIAEASARIKEQLNLIESNNKEESATKNNENINNLSNNLNNSETLPQKNVLSVNNSVLVSNDSTITKSADGNSVKKRVKRLPKENATNIQELRTKIINQFTSMSKGKIQNLVHNPSSTKYDVALQHLVRDMRLNLSSELRNMYNKSDTPQNESIISHFNTLVPDLGVEIANLPDTLVNELSNILQLDMNVLNDNDSKTNQNSDILNQNSGNLNQNSAKTNQISDNIIEPELFFKQAEQMLNNSDFNMLDFREDDFSQPNSGLNNLEMPFLNINNQQNERTCVKSEFGVPQTTPVYQESLFPNSTNFGVPNLTLPGNSNNLMPVSNFPSVQDPYFNFSHLANPIPPNFNLFPPVNVSPDLSFTNGTVGQSTFENNPIALEKQNEAQMQALIPDKEIYDPTQNISDDSNDGNLSTKTKKIQLVFKDVNKMAPKPFDINILNDLELTVQEDSNKERNITNKKAITTNLSDSSAKTKNSTASNSSITSNKSDSSKHKPLESVVLPKSVEKSSNLTSQKSHKEKLTTSGSSKAQTSSSSKDKVPTTEVSKGFLSLKKEQSLFLNKNQDVKQECIPLPGSSKEINQPLKDANIVSDTCKAKVSETSEVMKHQDQVAMSPNLNELDSKPEKRPSLERNIRKEDRRILEKRASKERSRKYSEKNSNKYIDDEVVIVDEYKGESKRHYKHSEERFEHSKHHGQRYEDSLEDYREHQRSRHVNKKESSRHKSPTRPKYTGFRSIVDNELPKHKTSLEERLKVLQQIESKRECNSKIGNDKKDKETSSKATIIDKEKEVVSIGKNKSEAPKPKPEENKNKIQNDKNKLLPNLDDIMKDVNKADKSKVNDKIKNISITSNKTQISTSQNKEQCTKDFFRQELLNFDLSHALFYDNYKNNFCSVVKDENENAKKETTNKEKKNSHKKENLQLTPEQEDTVSKTKVQTQEKEDTAKKLEIQKKKENLITISEKVDVPPSQTQVQTSLKNKVKEEPTLPQTEKKQNIAKDSLSENQNQEEVTKDTNLSKNTENVITDKQNLQKPDLINQINVEESQKNSQKIKLKRTPATQLKKKPQPPKDTKIETVPLELEAQQKNSNSTENKRNDSTSDKPLNDPKQNKNIEIAAQNLIEPKQLIDVTKSILKEGDINCKLNKNVSNFDTQVQTCNEEKKNEENTQIDSNCIQPNVINDKNDNLSQPNQPVEEDITPKPKSDSEILEEHVTDYVQFRKRPLVKIIRLTPGQIEDAVRAKDVIYTPEESHDKDLCQPGPSPPQNVSEEIKIASPSANSLQLTSTGTDELPANPEKSALEPDPRSQNDTVINETNKEVTDKDQCLIMEPNKSQQENKVDFLQKQMEVDDVVQKKPEKIDMFTKESANSEIIVPNTNSVKSETNKRVATSEITSNVKVTHEEIKKSIEEVPDSETISKPAPKEKCSLPDKAPELKRAVNVDCSQKTSDNLFKRLEELKKDKKSHDEKTQPSNNAKKHDKHVDRKHSSHHYTSHKESERNKNDCLNKKDHQKDKSSEENKMVSKDAKKNETTKTKTRQNLNKKTKIRDSSVESVLEKVSHRGRKISESSIDSHTEKRSEKSSKAASKSRKIRDSSNESIPEQTRDKANKSAKTKKNRDSSVESVLEDKVRKTRKMSESSVDSLPEKKSTKASKKSRNIRGSSTESVPSQIKTDKTTKTKNSRDSSVESVSESKARTKTRKISVSSVDSVPENKSNRPIKESGKTRKIGDSSTESIPDKSTNQSSKHSTKNKGRDSSIESNTEKHLTKSKSTKLKQTRDGSVESLPDKTEKSLPNNKTTASKKNKDQIKSSVEETTKQKKIQQVNKTRKQEKIEASSLEHLFDVDKTVTVVNSNKNKKTTTSNEVLTETNAKKPEQPESKTKKVEKTVNSVENVPEKNIDKPNKKGPKTKPKRDNTTEAKAKQTSSNKNRNTRDSSVDSEKSSIKPQTKAKTNKKIKLDSDESQEEIKETKSKEPEPKMADLKNKHTGVSHASKLESDISETEFLGFKPEAAQKNIKTSKRKMESPEVETKVDTPQNKKRRTNQT